MIALVFAMILCLVLGMAVVGLVAIPARRQGRELLTPHGEEMITRVKERTESVASARGRLHRTGLETQSDAAVVPPGEEPVAQPAPESRTEAESQPESPSRRTAPARPVRRVADPPTSPAVPTMSQELEAS